MKIYLGKTRFYDRSSLEKKNNIPSSVYIYIYINKSLKSNCILIWIYIFVQGDRYNQKGFLYFKLKLIFLNYEMID
jgi:hypothetical protein